jgi:Vanin C-terminal domain
LYPEQTCGLVACSGADVKTCGANKNDVLYTNDVSFTVLKLSGLFSSTKVAPVTMVGNEYMFPVGGSAEWSSSLQNDR